LSGNGCESGRDRKQESVVAVRGAGIHVLIAARKTWMAGTSPAKTAQHLSKMDEPDTRALIVAIHAFLRCRKDVRGWPKQTGPRTSCEGSGYDGENVAA
jgi:hypothetical protein